MSHGPGWRGMGRALAIAGVLAGAASASGPRAESVSALVAQGNELYKQGKLAEALQVYRRAEAQAPGSAALHYNIGNVLYRQGEFDKAYDQYRQAFSAREGDLAEGARFNAGNSHFARKNWQDAIGNYKEALRLNPADMDAKKNLELALLNMQQEQEQKQRQKQNQQQNDEQQDKQQQKQKPKEQDQERDQRNANDQKPEPRDQKPPAQEKDKLSREEAMRILDALKDHDKPPKDRLKVPPPDKRPEKDW